MGRAVSHTYIQHRHCTFGLQLGNYTTEGITQLCEGLKGSAITALDLSANDLDASAKQAVQAAAGSGAELLF